MALRDRVAALAAQRPHVLVAAAPGWDLLRMQVQAAIRRRGWVLASAPADADVLVTVGVPGDELRTLVDAAWAQVPAPRRRVDVRHEHGIDATLEAAAAALADRVGRSPHPEPESVTTAQQHEHEHEEGHEHGRGMRRAGARGSDGHGHGGDALHHGHAGREPSAGRDSHDMEDHGHGMDMSMDGPGGIPLASGFEDDRDGLEMDVLHLPLGPVLADWPAGLVLECTISGDVVVEAAPRLLSAGTSPSESSIASTGLVVARHLDAAVQILWGAGWVRAAERGARVLDAIVTGAPPATVRTEVARLARRVKRSRLLRWTLGERRPATTASSVSSRLATHLAAALAAAEGGVLTPLDEVEPGRLADAVRGRTLADARLLATGLAIRPAQIAVHDG